MNYCKSCRIISILWISVLMLPLLSGTSFALSVKVAAIEYRAIEASKSKNIYNLKKAVIEASDNGAKIIVLPEMCTTGLIIERKEDARRLAETVPGQTTNQFAILSKKYGIYLIFGMLEFDPHNEKYFNAQIMIGPDGNIVGKYRKVHLYGTDFKWADEGDLGYQVIKTVYGNIGLGICYDINFPYFLDFLTNNKVDIFAFSTNWISATLPFNYWQSLLKGRNMYFIAANNWGVEEKYHFSGGIIILSPDLTVLAKNDLPENRILYANISLDNNRSNTFLPK